MRALALRIAAATAVLCFLGFTPLPAPGGCPDDDCGGDGDTVPDSFDNCVLTPNASQTNSDGDSKGDACDSCSVVVNDQAPLYQATSVQCDADTDGFGNACDCDFNQDGACNAVDVSVLTLNFNKAAIPLVSDVADANCDGNVNAVDISNLTLHFNKLMGVAPKVSGLACASPTLARPGGCNVAFGE